MKKALLVLLALVCVCFIVANKDFLMSFFTTVQGGAVVPIVLAVVFMLARHVVQAMSYQAAFEAVDFKTTLWHNTVLIFNLVFINTFCLFSGATGVAFIIDDAHRQGADIGTASSGAVLSQIGYFAAVFVISCIGFVAMWLSGMLNWIFVTGGLLLGATLLVLLSLFFFGYFMPNVLIKVCNVVQRLAAKVMCLFKKDLPEDWGLNIAKSFIRSARVLASNPKGAFVTILYGVASALLNMACLIAIGFAFGFEAVGPLVSAFALAAISVILSPTPQGVGVVEAAIAAVLTGAGCSLSVATAIALVYRGIMFWIPFCIGAMLLSQAGFFKNKKDESTDAKRNDAGWVGGTLVVVCALVNLALAFVPKLFASYNELTQWVDLGNMLAGPALIAISVVMLLLGVGLVFRYRIVWGAAMALLSLIAGVELIYQETLFVAVPLALILVWLFWKRNAFDVPMQWPPRKPW